jgi:hypothetical protein
MVQLHGRRTLRPLRSLIESVVLDEMMESALHQANSPFALLVLDSRHRVHDYTSGVSSGVCLY